MLNGIQSGEVDAENNRNKPATQMLNSRFAAVLISFTFITHRNLAFAFGFGMVIEFVNRCCTLDVVSGGNFTMTRS